MDCTFYQGFTYTVLLLVAIWIIGCIVSTLSDAARKRREWRDRRERCDAKNEEGISILKTRVDNLINCLNGKHEYGYPYRPLYNFGDLMTRECHWCGAKEPKMSTKKGGK